MKKTRSTYHYMLRTLKKENIAQLGHHSQNQCFEIRIRITGRQLASNAKNIYNCTNVVDGAKDDSQIANLFKDKYEHLFNSVNNLESETELLKRNIRLEAKAICNKSETCRESKFVHCHIVSSADVSIALK